MGRPYRPPRQDGDFPNAKSDHDNSDDLSEDDSESPSPPPLTVKELEQEIDGLDGRIRELTGKIIENSGNKFDSWWHALLYGNADSDMHFSSVDRGETSLAEWEEQAMNGDFFYRVPYTKILAERFNDKVIPFFREEFLCVRKGFSILRAEWTNTLHNEELKRGHKVRDDWEERKDLEKGGGGEGFDVVKWEVAIKRDEELRWERRKLALERRNLMEYVAEKEGEWQGREASVENWWCLRQGRDKESEASELAAGVPRSRRESTPGPLGSAVGSLVALF